MSVEILSLGMNTKPLATAPTTARDARALAERALLPDTQLNNRGPTASDDIDTEAAGKTERIDTIVNDVKFFAHKLRKW